MRSVIVRYSEIGLKGKNKSDFETKLSKNIKSFLKKNEIKYEKVERKHSRIIITTNEYPSLSKVYGISSYCYALKTLKEIKAIKEEVKKQIKNYSSKTKFRVSTQRIDKAFKKFSMDVDREIGQFIVDTTKAKVDLKNFDKEIGIEILPDAAYVFDNRQKGPGGIPEGVEGRVIALIENENSKRAVELVKKRGCEVIEVEKENIKEIETIAEKNNAKALVVGQTLKTYKDINTNLIVFRPLIAE